MRSLSVFPELRFYGNGFSDFTIRLLQAFQGEEFSPAQWRALFRHVNVNGTGMTYLENLRDAIVNDGQVNSDTQQVIRAMIGRLRGIYTDAQHSGAQPIDLDTFFQMVTVRNVAQPKTVYRLSKLCGILCFPE